MTDNRQIKLLQKLLRLGKLTQDEFKAELGDLGIDPATVTFDQREQRIKQQFNAENIYTGPVYQGRHPSPSLDPTTALGRYLSHIIETNRRLQLQGIRSAGQLVSIDLEQVYITLSATTNRRVTTEEEGWLVEATKLAPGEGRRHFVSDSDSLIAVPVQQALVDYPRLVVLGDPGCGKTTLLRYLALTYARDLAGEVGLVKKRLNLGEQRLPVPMPLRDFARHLMANHPDPGLDGPALLLDYLRAYFSNQGIALPEGFFANRMEYGESAVLLDGLDEVADLPTRYRIARIIERFTISYPENRYVVTSRLVGYSNSARLGVEYAVTRVRDFSETDIQKFVTHWNLAVELTLARSNTQEARRLAQQQTMALLTAIESNERVRELAVNPLLLTVIALVQRYRAQLPERRTELYEEAVEVLLGQWDVAKGLADTADVAGRALDAGDRRSLLEPVALWMMERNWREIEADELKRQLGRQFISMLNDRHEVIKAVESFIRLINERSGLLVERGYGVYSFSHLTFQEHLAARAVADRGDYIDYTLSRLSDDWWREVILLEAGYLSTQGKRRGTALIKAIMDCPNEPVIFHNLVVAAECVRDVGVARIEGDLAGDIQQRIRRELKRPLQKGNRKAIEWRVAAAKALARIERSGSGLQPTFWRLPYGEPVWITIPAGEFWKSKNIYDDVTQCDRMYLPDYRIAQTLITNAQYLLFVAATKYRAPNHWNGNRPPKGSESHPVVYVNWFDTLAYCNWLSEMIGTQITLPSGAEWEKAARGINDRRGYPWGDRWDETKSNTDELRFGHTTPVGIFPEGASPFGCLDFAGNVWEWTRSMYNPFPHTRTFEQDVPNKTGEYCQIRGGSWSNSRQLTRCAYRFPYNPLIRNYDFGFRVVSALNET